MAVIGFVGLGNMGAPMAANLARAGHTVRGFDLAAEPRAAAEQAGIVWADDAAETARGAAAGSAEAAGASSPSTIDLTNDVAGPDERDT